jgi:hypothetical protein
MPARPGAPEDGSRQNTWEAAGADREPIERLANIANVVFGRVQLAGFSQAVQHLQDVSLAGAHQRVGFRFFNAAFGPLRRGLPLQVASMELAHVQLRPLAEDLLVLFTSVLVVDVRALTLHLLIGRCPMKAPSPDFKSERTDVVL